MRKDKKWLRILTIILAVIIVLVMLLSVLMPAFADDGRSAEHEVQTAENAFFVTDTEDGTC